MNSDSLNLNDETILLLNNAKSNKLKEIILTGTETSVLGLENFATTDKKKNNFKKICRFCLKTTEISHDFFNLTSKDVEFNPIYGGNITICDLYFIFTNVQLTENDEFPQQICAECLAKLKLCANFKTQAKTAEAILNYYVTEGFKTGMILEQLTEHHTKYSTIEIKNTENYNIIEENKDFHNKGSNEDPLQQNEDNVQSNNDYSKVIEENTAEKVQEKNQSENTEEENLLCPICDESFKIKNDLEIHKSIHSKQLICLKCNKQFKDMKKLRRHVKIHYSEKPYKCLECNKGFSEINELNRHIRSKSFSQKRIRKFFCTEPNCDRRYFDAYSLMIHIRTHKNEKPYKCNNARCDKSFTDIRLLNSHIKTHLNEKKYSCSNCDRKFNHKSTLTSHIRTHTNERLYFCVICQKSFIQSSNLRVHMRKHTDEKLYNCTDCKKSFNSSSALAIHSRTHSSERPYSCSICSKTFACSDLSAHMRIHRNEKPFECKECQRKFFRTLSQLKVHKKKIHASNLECYTCNICSKSWLNLSSLKRHTLKIHKVNYEDDVKESAVAGQNIKQNIAQQQLIEEDEELNESMMLVNELLASITD